MSVPTTALSREGGGSDRTTMIIQVHGYLTVRGSQIRLAHPRNFRDLLSCCHFWQHNCFLWEELAFIHCIQWTSSGVEGCW